MENNKTYLISIDDVGIKTCHLRVDPLPNNISEERVNLASKYEL